MFRFTNKDGKTVDVPAGCTIKELHMMGIVDIRLQPIGSPISQDPNVYVHVPKQEK